MLVELRVSADPELIAAVHRLTNAIGGFATAVSKQGAQVMSKLDDLEAEVATQTSVEASVETLVTNIVSQIQAADPNNERIAAVLATLQANDARLGQLVTQNTPVQTPVVDPPAPQ